MSAILAIFVIGVNLRDLPLLPPAVVAAVRRDGATLGCCSSTERAGNGDAEARECCTGIRTLLIDPGW